MYISEKDFNNLKTTYAELLKSVSYLEEYLQNFGICLDKIKRDNREEIEEEGSWDCTMCNDCTCDEEKEKPKSVVTPIRESFNEGVKIIPTKTMDKPDPKPNTNSPKENKDN